jgi:hypothetical protein
MAFIQPSDNGRRRPFGIKLNVYAARAWGISYRPAHISYRKHFGIHGNHWQWATEKAWLWAEL